jgi:hypothetical protein
MNPNLRDIAVTTARRIELWASNRRSQLALVGRFGPMTARAWASVLRVVVAEKLWRVPHRARPDIATAGTSP